LIKAGPHPADHQVVTPATAAMDGVRLLSHRPSVLYKVEHLATEPAEGDIAVEGLLLAGPGWDEKLKAVIKSLSLSERACLFAVRLSDEQMLPVPAETLLDRTRTDWFPEFLSHGRMHPHFQPIVELHSGLAYGREALMRGKLGAVELRGAELMAAAEAHDAIFSFDYRARTAALEVGLPILPEGEILFVNLDPRASLDVESSLRTTWPVVGRLGADPSRICLEFTKPERCPDRELLKTMAEAHRKRGAKIALDDLSGGPDSLACLELLCPDIAKIDTALTAGIQHSPARRALVKALVDCAHEMGARVVAEGVERVDEFRAMAELGVDLGQGFYFGQPTERPMAVDTRLVRPSV
jgi:EAL domain-containing protein (putative c-di-GMP-specific phosphodiesterase class I)